MSFLALPFTFPILIICALAGYPIYAVGRALIENAIAFFTLNSGLKTKLGVLERLEVVIAATFYDVCAAMRGYGRAIVKGAKRAAAWITLALMLIAASVFVGLGLALGLLPPIYNFIKNSIEMGATASSDMVQGTLDSALDFVAADVSR